MPGGDISSHHFITVCNLSLSNGRDCDRCEKQSSSCMGVCVRRGKIQRVVKPYEYITRS